MLAQTSHSQDATAYGSHNVIVQIDGHNNHVDIAKPHLCLKQPWKSFRGTNEEALRLMCAETCSIPLYGRTGLMTELLGWLAQGNDISTRIILGDGGQGKTRLALELCKQAENKGWDAGFVTAQEMSRFISIQNLQGWGWSKPTLVVVDYAAAKVEQLRNWFKELAERPESKVPLRLLLLERHGSLDAGWILSVFDPGDFSGPRYLLGASTLIKLGTIDEEKINIFREAYTRHPSGKKLPALPSDFDKQLSNLSWGGQPLYIIMAGWIAAEKNLPTLLSLRSRDLPRMMARRERSQLITLARRNHIGEKVLPFMAAIATLRQGLEEESYCLVLKQVKKDLHWEPATEADATYWEASSNAWPEEGKQIVAPIRPDLIGEAFLIEEEKLNRIVWKKALAASFHAEPLNVSEVCFRTIQDFSDSPDISEWGESLVKESWENYEHLRILSATLPNDSVALGALGLKEVRSKGKGVGDLAMEQKNKPGDKFGAAGLQGNSAKGANLRRGG